MSSTTLFAIGLGILLYSGVAMLPPTSGERNRTGVAQVWPPVLIYAGALIMLCGALAFVSAFSTHTRMAANLPPKDLIEL